MNPIFVLKVTKERSFEIGVVIAHFSAFFFGAWPYLHQLCFKVCRKEVSFTKLQIL